MTMLIYKVSVLDTMGFEREETKYYQHLESANEHFYRRVNELKHEFKLADKDDLDDQEPVRIHESNPHRDNFVRSATLNHWESYPTDCGTEHDITETEVIITKHELITE